MCPTGQFNSNGALSVSHAVASNIDVISSLINGQIKGTVLFLLHAWIDEFKAK